jgi:hypothetical protein
MRESGKQIRFVDDVADGLARRAVPERTPIVLRLSILRGNSDCHRV